VRPPQQISDIDLIGIPASQIPEKIRVGRISMIIPIPKGFLGPNLDHLQKMEPGVTASVQQPFSART
jgi:hypothetical protein